MPEKLWIAGVQIDSSQIEAWGTHETEEFLQDKEICADLSLWATYSSNISTDFGKLYTLQFVNLRLIAHIFDGRRQYSCL